MISYEELCQALDLHNNRQKNAAEMAALDKTDDAGDFEQMQPGFPMGNVPAGTREAMRSIPTAVDPLDFATASGGRSTSSKKISTDALHAQPGEDTHEIDVDDVEMEDK